MVAGEGEGGHRPISVEDRLTREAYLTEHANTKQLRFKVGGEFINLYSWELNNQNLCTLVFILSFLI